LEREAIVNANSISNNKPVIVPLLGPLQVSGLALAVCFSSLLGIRFCSAYPSPTHLLLRNI
jgi:hypothetical protein